MMWPVHTLGTDLELEIKLILKEISRTEPEYMNMPHSN